MDFQVTVITPVYNAEPFLRRSAESALQIPEVAELILVEDGSPDNALQVCRELVKEHPERVSLYRHENGVNKGAGPSRNLGISKAKSPFIAFLDADDLYLPHRFKNDAKILLNEPTIDGVYNAIGVTFLNEAGRKWWKSAPNHPPELTTVRKKLLPEELFFNISLMGNYGHFSPDGLTVRRHVFDKLQFSNLRLSQDTLLNLQLAAKFRLAPGILDEPVALRGVHGENRIMQDGKRMRAREAIIEELFAWAEHGELSSKQHAALYPAYIRSQPDWQSVRQAIRRRPEVLWKIKCYPAMIKRALFRVTLNEPIIPGLFSQWRSQKTNNNK